MSLSLKLDCCKPDDRKIAFKAKVHLSDAAQKLIDSNGYEKIREGVALFSDYAAKNYAVDADIFISTGRNFVSRPFAISVKTPKPQMLPRKESLCLDALRPPKLIFKDLTKAVDSFFKHIKVGN